jgi:hypothetical protein
MRFWLPSLSQEMAWSDKLGHNTYIGTESKGKSFLQRNGGHNSMVQAHSYD